MSDNAALHSYSDNLRSQNSSGSLDVLNNLKKSETVQQSPIGTLIQKVKNWYSSFSSERDSRSYEALRSQEHLLDSGSYTRAQLKAFQKVLNESDKTAFKKLSNEMGNVQHRYQYATVRQKVSYAKGAVSTKNLLSSDKYDRHSAWQFSIRTKLDSLRDNESLWIDAGSSAVGHHMMMRLTKHINKDTQKVTYTMEFSNTGFGVDSNRDFHPSRTYGIADQEREELQQTVAVIRNIDEDTLLKKNFFRTYSHISEFGTRPDKSWRFGDLDPPEAEAKASKQEEPVSEEKTAKKEKIDLLYQTLRGLGTPEQIEPENEGKKYWSRPQIGGSCVPGSIMAMAKVILSEADFQALKDEIKIKSLLCNYKAITEGHDTSPTRQLLVLDQIQKLQRIYQKRNQTEPEALQEIHDDLLKRLKMTNPEMKVRSNLTIDSLIDSSTNQIVPLRAELKARDSSLEFSSTFQQDANLINYSVTRDENNRLVGKDVFDNTYLLYFHVANGDHESANFYLQKVMASLEEIKKDDPKGLQTVSLLSSLSQNLIRDRTRGGIAKANFLNELALLQLARIKGAPAEQDHKSFLILSKLASSEEKLKQELLDQSYDLMESYRQLSVNKHLSSTNQWNASFRQIQASALKKSLEKDLNEIRYVDLNKFLAGREIIENMLNSETSILLSYASKEWLEANLESRVLSYLKESATKEESLRVLEKIKDKITPQQAHKIGGPFDNEYKKLKKQEIAKAVKKDPYIIKQLDPEVLEILDIFEAIDNSEVKNIPELFSYTNSKWLAANLESKVIPYLKSHPNLDEKEISRFLNKIGDKITIKQAADIGENFSLQHKNWIKKSIEDDPFNLMDFEKEIDEIPGIEEIIDGSQAKDEPRLFPYASTKWLMTNLESKVIPRLHGKNLDKDEWILLLNKIGDKITEKQAVELGKEFEKIWHSSRH